MQKTFSSRYIKKKKMKPEDAEALSEDIRLYGKMTREIVQDLRVKRTGSQPSIHCEYKQEYKVSDYFVTSVERKAKGIRDAAEAALKLDIAAKTRKMGQMETKAASLEKQLKNLDIMKQSLITRAKARKNNQPVPEFQSYFGSGVYTSENQDGTAQFIVDFDRRKKTKKKKRAPLIFENDYLFELHYLDPAIRKKRARLHNIRSRIHNTVGHLEVLKKRLKEERFTICFGGKKVSSSQYTAYAGRHNDWKNVFHKKRSWEMMLVGRHDASQGNFMVRYDTDSHQLVYKGRNGTASIVLDNVFFPYGQELVDTAVDTSKHRKEAKKWPDGKKTEVWEPLSVTWCIKDCGNAFLVKCSFSVPERKDINICYDDGCIGFDMNYDHLAVSETDKYGHLVTHYTVDFSPEGKTSNQMNNMISEALEKVFLHAVDVKKPVAMEDIEKIQNNDSLYSNKKRNRKVSAFAYDKMKTLAQNKSQKYQIGLKQVNPAFTSQIGKMKYMRQFGISIHESASYVIARRAMGLKEKVPRNLHALLPKKKKTTHHWSQWKYLSTKLKSVPVHKFYSAKKFNNAKSLSKLKEQLLA